MLINIVYIDADRSYRYGEEGIHEAFTDNVGELFKYCQKELGRCVSSIYIDTSTGVKRIGWVFSKRVPYEDTGELYTREVWVTLHEKRPTVTRETRYKEI